VEDCSLRLAPGKDHKTWSEELLKNAKRGGGIAQVVECLPNTCAILSETPVLPKKKVKISVLRWVSSGVCGCHTVCSLDICLAPHAHPPWALTGTHFVYLEHTVFISQVRLNKAGDKRGRPLPLHCGRSSGPQNIPKTHQLKLSSLCEGRVKCLGVRVGTKQVVLRMINRSVDVRRWNYLNYWQSEKTEPQVVFFMRLSHRLSFHSFVFPSVGLGFELRALNLRSRHSTPWVTPPVHFALVILEMETDKLFVLPFLKSQFWSQPPK
jgi:hypothetical protein